MKDNAIFYLIGIIIIIVVLVSKGESKPDTSPKNMPLKKALLTHSIAYDKMQSSPSPEMQSNSKVEELFQPLDLSYVYNASEVKEITETNGKSSEMDVEELVVGPGCTPKESCSTCPFNCTTKEKILIEAPKLKSNSTTTTKSKVCKMGQYYTAVPLRCTSTSKTRTCVRSRSGRLFSRIRFCQRCR